MLFCKRFLHTGQQTRDITDVFKELLIMKDLQCNLRMNHKNMKMEEMTQARMSCLLASISMILTSKKKWIEWMKKQEGRKHQRKKRRKRNARSIKKLQDEEINAEGEQKQVIMFVV